MDYNKGFPTDHYKDYDPGDVVYIEGVVEECEFFPKYNETEITITDGQKSAMFSIEGDYTDIKKDDRVILKVKIIDTTEGKGPTDPIFFKEDDKLIGVEKIIISKYMISIYSSVISFATGIILIIVYVIVSFRKNSNEKSDK